MFVSVYFGATWIDSVSTYICICVKEREKLSEGGLIIFFERWPDFALCILKLCAAYVNFPCCNGLSPFGLWNEQLLVWDCSHTSPFIYGNLFWSKTVKLVLNKHISFLGCKGASFCIGWQAGSITDRYRCKQIWISLSGCTVYFIIQNAICWCD